MLKYLNAEVTFTEIPDKITLCINIVDCPCHCKGCHSLWLWDTFKWNAKNISIYGNPTELNKYSLFKLIEANNGIDCVAFMGGDSEPFIINNLARHIKNTYDNINIAWYSGKQELSKNIELKNFDYIKLGPYIAEKGGLDNPNTNQKLYEINRLSKLPEKFKMNDITNKFWK